MSNIDEKINTSLADVWRTTHLGDKDRAIGSAFYGINHRQTPSQVPINRDMYGLTFFTRPQLNLSSANVRAERSLIPLLTNAETSVQRMIRCYLDPRLHMNKDKPLNCPFVDHESAFIPLLTNHLLTCTNWPDSTLDTFTSKPGSHKEVYGMVDSMLDNFGSFDLSLSFRNMQSDPITELFRVWTIYEASVFKGIMVPYPDFLVRNEIDYQTRVYRLVLDKNKNTVQKIGATGASFPVSTPLGAAFNFDSDKPFNSSNDQISISLRSFGALYQDAILVHEFNKIVGVFKPEMRELALVGSKGKRNDTSGAMMKVPPGALTMFNNRGYPRIDPNSYELQWYVPKDDYADVMKAYTAHNSALTAAVATNGE